MRNYSYFWDNDLSTHNFKFIITMGKGDKKTKRGKIIMGSYGVRRRPNKKSSARVVTNTQPVAPEPETKAKPKAKKAKPAVSEEKE